MPELEPQEFHTEPSLSSRKMNPRNIETSKNDSNNILNSNQLTQHNSAPFRFERNKVRNFKIDPSIQTDINDEKIQNLKNQIIDQYKRSARKRMKYAELLKAISISLISVNIMEIVAFIFLFIIIVMDCEYIDEILFWTAIGILLSIFEIFINLKTMKNSKETAINEIKKFICFIKISLCFFMLGFTFVLLVIAGVISNSEEEIDEDQEAKVTIMKSAILIVSFFKVISQFVILCISSTLKRQLQALPTDANGNIELEPTFNA